MKLIGSDTHEGLVALLQLLPSFERLAALLRDQEECHCQCRASGCIAEGLMILL